MIGHLIVAQNPVVGAQGVATPLVIFDHQLRNKASLCEADAKTASAGEEFNRFPGHGFDRLLARHAAPPTGIRKT